MTPISLQMVNRVDTAAASMSDRDQGTPRSLKVIIRITDRCNQDCTYCYVDRETRRSTRLTLSLEAISHLYAQILTGRYFQHVHIVWHGGEPTLVGHEYLR